MSQLKTVEQLRNVLPAPRETTKAKILPFLDQQAIDFLQTCPFGLMATAGREGPIEVSPKGDEPGFVRVENETTVLLPERAGNNLAFGLQNIIETGRIGMIFLRPRTGETLRLSGRAEIFDDADLLAALGKPGRPALLAISTARVR
jgi:predicted pyridoxine 5'-phosphate oxidase superfamily flavin-nucleotide-binding protein